MLVKQLSLKLNGHVLGTKDHSILFTAEHTLLDMSATMVKKAEERCDAEIRKNLAAVMELFVEGGSSDELINPHMDGVVVVDCSVDKAQGGWVVMQSLAEDKHRVFDPHVMFTDPGAKSFEIDGQLDNELWTGKDGTVFVSVMMANNFADLIRNTKYAEGGKVCVQRVDYQTVRSNVYFESIGSHKVFLQPLVRE